MSGAVDRLAGRLTILPEGKAALGLSGGADSTALMLMLLTAGCDILAIHVNHGLRGSESDGDEAFVKALCAEHDVPLAVFRIDLKGKRDEQTAREARMTCFAECLRERGIGELVLAHNRDDLAETYLMRLMRGSGPEGLGCMEETDERNGFRILRPMIEIGREEIRDALRQDGISWREDSSNEDTAYFRNAVRKELIPLMNRLSPGAGERIAGTARMTAADNKALGRMTEEALRGHENHPWLDTALMSGQPEAVRARMIRRWWRTNGPKRKQHELSRKETEAVLRLAEEKRGTVNLPGGFRCVRGKRFLHLTGPKTEPEEAKPWQAPETAFGGLILRTGPTAGSPGDGKRSQEVPAGFAKGCVLRTRRAGDRIRPFGMEHHRKLQDYLTDRQVDGPWRDRIPLLCRGNEVLLCAGIGAGDIPRWTEDTESERLTWEGPMPWMNETERNT